MAAFRWITLVGILLAAQAASAASLGVAWVPNPDSTVTGYRIYVGTSPGTPDEFFDVGPSQTSFFYRTAVAGQVYYFSVASLAPGISGVRSPEVSGFAPTTAALASMPPRTASAVNTRADLADGLGPVSSLVVDHNGVGVFIESGTRVRTISPAGVAAQPAFEAQAHERVQAVALDVDFERSRRVFIAVSTVDAAGTPRLDVVRHRLVAGVLGESAVLVPGLATPADAASLAVSSSGQLFVVSAGQVFRFEADGRIPNDNPSASALWATIDGDFTAALWDTGAQALWLAGQRTTGGAVVASVAPGVGPRVMEVASTHGERVSHISLSQRAAQTLALVVTSARALSVEMPDGATTAVTVGVPGARIVGWAPFAADGSYVVLGPDELGGNTSHRIVQVRPGG